MKQFFILLFISLAIGNVAMAQAGDDRLKEIAAAAAKKAEGDGWLRGAGLGFDFSGLGILNPRVGAGLNRLGFGGLGTFFANNKKGKMYWDNGINLQLGVVRLGTSDDPFTKNIDLLRMQSKGGYAITKNGKWFASALAIGTTSLLKTYEGNVLKGNEANLFSQLLAPAQLQFHPGIEYKPNTHWSFLLSPVGLNLLYVGNQSLADKNIHGNELGKKSRLQVVPALQASYNNKFFNDRVSYVTSLNMTTNYLNQPFVLTALNFWQHNISVNIWKGLSLDLFGELAYDHFKPVQKDVNKDGIISLGTINPITADGKIPTTTGDDKLAYGTQFTRAFLLKYNRIF